MVSARLRHVARRILSSSAILMAYGVCSPAAAEPVHVTGSVFIDSAGGDFPDIPQPIDELIYFLAGNGLVAPAPRNEMSGSGRRLETIASEAGMLRRKA